MPLADCLRPFNQSDRHKVQPLINELRQAVGDDHLLGIQTELFDVLVKIVGNFPLSSGSGYFWPGSYIDFSLKLSRIALNLLRQRIQFFTMPLAQKEFETQLLKLLVLTICFFLNLRITAMTFCVAAENGDEFRFEVPYEDWFKEHEGQELTLYHNVDPDPEAAAGNINRLVLKYLPESLQKRFAKSFKRGYLALLSKFIRGDVGSIVKDEFILILISQAESILREQMTTEFARKGEEPPHYIPSILSWAICALLANELSPEAALRKSDAIGNKEPLQIVARAITCKDGEIYAVIEYFFPLLTAKLQELFPRQTWREKEVLRMCCQCGIFDLKEGATFEEVANRIEIYKKCGKEVVSTPVQGLRFNNFLLYVANDSYFGRTVQSLQAKHSVDANGRVWVIDIGRSYEKLCHCVNGQWIELSDTPRPDGKIDCLNPLSVTKNIEADMDLVLPLIAQMASSNEQLDDLMLSHLQIHIRHIWYEAKALNKVPTITDLTRSLLHNGRLGGAHPRLNDPEWEAYYASLTTEEQKTLDDPRLVDLGVKLMPYAQGGAYASFFDGEANIDFDNHFIVLELEQLNTKKSLQAVVLMLLMYLIDVEMRRGERSQPKLVIIDEAWDLMVRGHSSKFIEAGYRRARKLNGAFFTGTQGPGDYWKSSAAKAALDNADCKFIMKLKESVLSECEKESQLGLDDYELQQLRSLKGLRDVYSEVLVKIGDAPTSVNRLILDPFSLLVMSTHPKDISDINRFRKEGLSMRKAIEAVLLERGQGEFIP